MKQITFKDAIILLKKYRLDFVNHQMIRSEGDLEKLDYPIAMKVFSEKIIHKSDKGGVIIGIKNKEESTKAFEKLKKISKDVIAQRMVFGKEIIIGMKKDPQFGPVIMFGLGGVFVEVMKDVSFRVCPITKDEALNMIKEIKSYKILEGIRGEKGVNINMITDIIVKISKLSMKEKINEIDLNPIIVNDKEAVIVDVRLMV